MFHIIVHLERFYSEELNSVYGNVKGVTGFWQCPLFCVPFFLPWSCVAIYIYDWLKISLQNLTIIMFVVLLEGFGCPRQGAAMFYKIIWRKDGCSFREVSSLRSTEILLIWTSVESALLQDVKNVFFLFYFTGETVKMKQVWILGYGLMIVKRKLGRLIFTKSFRKIRLDSKLNTTFWVVPSENFPQEQNIWRGSPV